MQFSYCIAKLYICKIWIYTAREKDNSYVVGLVLEITPDALNSFVGAFYNIRTSSDMDVSIDDLNFSNPDMVLFATRDLLDMDVWSVINDNVTNVKTKDFMDLAELESHGFVGVEVIGSGVIINAFNILNHLSPNNFAEPEFLESLLYRKDYFKNIGESEEL